MAAEANVLPNYTPKNLTHRQHKPFRPPVHSAFSTGAGGAVPVGHQIMLRVPPVPAFGDRDGRHHAAQTFRLGVFSAGGAGPGEITRSC